MAVSYRLELVSPGIRSLVASDGAQTAVEAKADEIADRARARGVLVEGEPGTVALPITTSRARTAGRARALVVIDHPSGLAVEAKHRLLGGALG